MLVLIDMFRVFDDRITILPVTIPENLVEAAFPTGVADNAAALLDLHDDHVVVAIQAQLMQHLYMARLFTLAPQLAPGAGPVDGAAFRCGELQRFAVHPGDHEYAAAGGVLGDGRDQAVGVPFDAVQPVGIGSGIGHIGWSSESFRVAAVAPQYQPAPGGQ